MYLNNWTKALIEKDTKCMIIVDADVEIFHL